MDFSRRWGRFCVHRGRTQNDGPDKHKQDSRNRSDHGECATTLADHQHKLTPPSRQIQEKLGQAFRRYRARFDS